MNKILIKLYIPLIEEQYDVWIPLNRKIYTVIKLLVKGANGFSGGYYNPTKMPNLFDKISALPYDVNLTIKEANIKNID